MSNYATEPIEMNFLTMTIMWTITLLVSLFSLTAVVSSLVPYFQIAALAMTIYVGYRSIRTKNKKNGN